MSKMAYCPKCKNIVEYSNFSLNCRICGSGVRGSYMESIEWESKSQDEKNRFLAELNGEEIESNSTQVKQTSEIVDSDFSKKSVASSNNHDEELIRHIRRIDNDVHFIKTVVLVYIIASIVLGIYFGIKLATLF